MAETLGPPLELRDRAGRPLADIVVVESPTALAHEAGELFAQAAADAIDRRGRFMVALAGGATPRGLYACLAAEPFLGRVGWPRTWIFFGDERCVPPTDRNSNYLTAHEALLAHVPVPSGQIFRIPGEAARPALAAAEYDRMLRTVFEPEPVRFDLALLGLGIDGHVASLFPGAPALEERDRLVVAVETRAAVVPNRITLTLPVFNAARRVLFLAAGVEKARPVADALRNAASPSPAARVRPIDGTLTWVLDRAAAGSLG